jgi:hypothetical protein
MSITNWNPDLAPPSCEFCKGIKYLHVEGSGPVPCPYCRGAGSNQWRTGATQSYLTRRWIWHRLRVLICIGIFVGCGTIPGIKLGIPAFLVDCVVFGFLIRYAYDAFHGRNQGVNSSSSAGSMAATGLGLVAVRNYNKHQRQQNRGRPTGNWPPGRNW